MLYRDGPCPKGCGGYLGIRSTERESGGVRTRVFECRKCGEQCSCEIPAESVQRRDRGSAA